MSKSRRAPAILSTSLFFAATCLFTAILGTTAAAAKKGPETVLYDFGAFSEDGILPAEGLVEDVAGNLYGTTNQGGTSGLGTVFMLSPADSKSYSYTIIHNFSGSDGSYPGLLTIDKNGALYGTALDGGTSNDGTVFQLIPPKKSGGKWKENTLYNFCCADGRQPSGAVVSDKNGALFGTTNEGGGVDAGTIYRLTPPILKGGAWTKTTLYSFCSQANCTDGQYAQGTVLLTNAGVIYATALRGGTANLGTLISLTPGQGDDYSFNLVHSFNESDGANPLGEIGADKSGTLYGVTQSGGSNGCGAIFSYNSTAQPPFQSLYSFCAQSDHSDGSTPQSGVIVQNDKDGTALYGTTELGGNASSGGVVFKLTPGQIGDPWNEQILYTLCGQLNCTDGSHPINGTLLRIKNSLYGAAANGGKNGKGVVYKIKE